LKGEREREEYEVVEGEREEISDLESNISSKAFDEVKKV
jgi:hypothetical protein